MTASLPDSITLDEVEVAFSVSALVIKPVGIVVDIELIEIVLMASDDDAVPERYVIEAVEASFRLNLAFLRSR